MEIVKQIISLFVPEPSELTLEENHEFFKFTVSTFELIFPLLVELKASLSNIPERDIIEIIFRIGADESIVLNSNCGQVELDYLRESSEMLVGQNIQVIVNVNKHKSGKIISIYSINAFTEYLSGLNLIEKLGVFKILLDGGWVIFSTFENIEEFQTQILYFRNRVNENSVVDVRLNNSERIDKIKNVCHFELSGEYSFLPSDFHIIERKAANLILNSLLDRLEMAFAIICLFNISKIVDDEIIFRLEGYKTVKGSLDINSLDLESSNEYCKIFDWVYNEGNVSDKIGLARNIISIHLTDLTQLTLKGNPYFSVKSGYDIYLKDNIKQYIDIRDKISSQLFEFSQRSNKLVEEYGNNFQKNILGFLSFFATVVVVRAISTSGFANLFTNEVAWLSYFFVIVSILYFIISLWDLNLGRKRIVNSYTLLKRRYEDLLDPNDITRILNNDVEFRNDMNYITRKRNYISLLWVVCFSLLSGLILILSPWLSMADIYMFLHKCIHLF